MSDRDLSRRHSPVQAAFLREFQRCAKWRSRAVLLRRRVGLSGYSYGSTARMTDAKLNASFCGPRYHSLTQIAARAAQSADREPSASNQGYGEWRFRPRPDDPPRKCGIRDPRQASLVRIVEAVVQVWYRHELYFPTSMRSGDERSLDDGLRRHYEQDLTLRAHLRRMAEALIQVGHRRGLFKCRTCRQRQDSHQRDNS